MWRARLDEAMHLLTLLTFGAFGEVLAPQNGAPLRITIPWKHWLQGRQVDCEDPLCREGAAHRLGQRQAPANTASTPTSTQPSITRAGARQPSGASEFSKRKTLMFNGYADQVASLYTGMDRRSFTGTVLATVGVVQLPLALAGPRWSRPLATPGTKAMEYHHQPFPGNRHANPRPATELSATGLRSSRHRAAGIRHRHIPDVCTQGQPAASAVGKGVHAADAGHSSDHSCSCPPRSVPPCSGTLASFIPPVQCFRLHHRAEGFISRRAGTIGGRIWAT